MIDGEGPERPYEVWLTVTRSYRLRGIVRAIDHAAAEKSELARVEAGKGRRLPPGDYVLEDVRIEASACAASADAVRAADRPRRPTGKRKI